jgi:hypothetical protein
MAKDVEHIIRTAARIGLNEQIDYLSDAIGRLQDSIHDDDATTAEIDSRDIVKDAETVRETVLALVASGFLEPFHAEQTQTRRARRSGLAGWHAALAVTGLLGGGWLWRASRR